MLSKGFGCKHGYGVAEKKRDCAGEECVRTSLGDSIRNQRSSDIVKWKRQDKNRNFGSSTLSDKEWYREKLITKVDMDYVSEI
jgi:hypothetical protein